MKQSAPPAEKSHRGTIHVENAVLIDVQEFPGEQFVMRLSAPLSARYAIPGSFVHIQCNGRIAMRRPLSIMRTSSTEGWIEVLFKVVGDGLRALGQAKPGDVLSIIGPIGNGFTLHEQRSRPLLIGGGVGIPPMIFLAEEMQRQAAGWMPVVLMGSEIDFPFETAKSQIDTPWLDEDISTTLPLVEKLGVCARLASNAEFSGCFDGFVTDLARRYLQSLSTNEINEVEIYSCGPTPMLRAVAALAAEFDLPCQVSLEEFMACAVGGCAGCAVEVVTDQGPAMKRVCVDGPVFEAQSVFA